MGLFHHKHDPGDPAKGGPDGAFEIVGADGNWVRYAPGDFAEIITTTEEPEMRRYLDLGWLLLDEQVAKQPGSTPRGSTRRSDGMPGASFRPETTQGMRRRRTSRPTSWET